MASSALVIRTSLDSDNTIYSQNFLLSTSSSTKPNDADSDETSYFSNKEATPEVNPDHHPIATSPITHTNAQLKEIHGELRVVQKELYEVHFLNSLFDYGLLCFNGPSGWVLLDFMPCDGLTMVLNLVGLVTVAVCLMIHIPADACLIWLLKVAL
ncbi:uncharacterized protein G2W53_014481 [Senna tora]|uniref:Uncharacterized protein n=1 Tax=Senna tora TaxID=362788 RepID=A0A834WTC5_9FABA|nr:uncharacterized protein G2W53_014481 [Senna tora]